MRRRSSTTSCASTASRRCICRCSSRAATPTRSRWSTASVAAWRNLLDVPKQLIASVVFDQSQFVRNAIENLIHEGVIGLVLTGIMILVFLGSLRATAAVFLSIPLSALAAFIALSFGDSTINTMILGRSRARVLAPHRQLGGGAGEHLPTHGAGRAAGGGRGARR